MRLVLSIAIHSRTVQSFTAIAHRNWAKRFKFRKACRGRRVSLGWQRQIRVTIRLHLSTTTNRFRWPRNKMIPFRSLMDTIMWVDYFSRDQTAHEAIRLSAQQHHIRRIDRRADGKLARAENRRLRHEQRRSNHKFRRLRFHRHATPE